MSIHPLALIAPSARIGHDVQIGPFCVVEHDVTIGSECILESHVVIKHGTTLGENNHLLEGAVIGGIPQHINVPERIGRVVIGSGNTIRENVTIHRAMQPDHETVIGDHCLLMCNAHVAHDCCLGDHVILTNNVMLAGHVTVGARAFLSGGAGVHQFCRVGTLAMVGGLAHISRDVPPFVTIDGQSSYVVGLNKVGLKRAGYDTKSIVRVKDAYRVIYRSGLMWKEILAQLEQQFHDEAAAEFLPFLASSKRGIIPERRMPPGATIRIHPVEDQEEEPARPRSAERAVCRFLNASRVHIAGAISYRYHIALICKRHIIDRKRNAVKEYVMATTVPATSPLPVSDKLPELLRPLLWDSDFDQVTWRGHRDYVVRRVLSAGTWDAVCWLRAASATAPAPWIEQHQGRGLSSRQLRFWELVLDLPRPLVDTWLASEGRKIWEGRGRG